MTTFVKCIKCGTVNQTTSASTHPTGWTLYRNIVGNDLCKKCSEELSEIRYQAERTFWGEEADKYVVVSPKHTN